MKIHCSLVLSFQVRAKKSRFLCEISQLLKILAINSRNYQILWGQKGFISNNLCDLLATSFRPLFYVLPGMISVNSIAFNTISIGGSQPGVILPTRRYMQGLETPLVATPGRGCYWLLMGRGWGCYKHTMHSNKELSSPGASLVAQWLRICLLVQGTRVRALVWEDPTCHGATRPVSHNYWACASGACAPQQERPR